MFFCIIHLFLENTRKQKESVYIYIYIYIYINKERKIRKEEFGNNNG